MAVPEKGELGRPLFMGQYVYWVSEASWDSETQNSKDNRKSIGKLLDDDKTKMWPNDYFLELFGDLQDVQSLLHHRVIGVGTYIFARKAAENTGVLPALKKAFPSHWRKIFALCVQWIDEEESCAQDFGYWFQKNFCGFYTRLDQPAISRFHAELSKLEDARETYEHEFGIEYSKRFPRTTEKPKWIVGCDGTNSNTTDKDNVKAGYGHAKEDSNLPIVNTMSFVDEETGITMFSHDFPGPVLDKNELIYSLSKAIELGFQKLHLMFDRGFITKEKALFLKDLKEDYGIVFSAMVPETFTFARKVILEYKNILYNNSEYYIDSQKIYGLKLDQMPIFEDDPDCCYGDLDKLYDVYLFYDDKRAATERQSVLDKYRAFLNAVLEKKQFSEKLVSDAAPYVIVTKTEKDPVTGRDFRAVINHELRQKELDLKGYFITISNASDITAEEEITIARHRDKSEKSFRRKKTFFELTRPDTETEETYEGKMFIAKVAQNIVESIEYYARPFITARTSDTVNTLLKELRSYCARVRDDGHLVPEDYMTSRQKSVFMCLGLSFDIVEHYVRSLTWGIEPGDIFTAKEIRQQEKAKKKAAKEAEREAAKAAKKAAREAAKAAKKGARDAAKKEVKAEG